MPAYLQHEIQKMKIAVRNLVCLLILLLSVFTISCKEDETTPVPVPLADTLNASQYVMCKIDTINYLVSIQAGRKDTIKMATNNSILTKWYSASKIQQNGQFLIRNLELILYEFQDIKVGTYLGSKIFSTARTDLLVNGNEIDNQAWTIYNNSINIINVTAVNDSIARGNFTFRMQNGSNSSRFLNVTNGHFKVRIR